MRLITSFMMIVFFYRITMLYENPTMYSVDSHYLFLIQLLMYIYSRLLFLVKYFYLYFNFNIINTNAV